MANKSRSKTAEGYSASYKSNRKWEANRKRKLERVLKKQPNNEQVKLAIKNIVYRRKTPTTRVWSARWIATAKLFKEFAGKFDPDIMSSNSVVAATAVQTSRKNRDYTPTVGKDKNMFSLLCRANLNSFFKE